MPFTIGTVWLLSVQGGISIEKAEAPNKKGVLPASRGASVTASLCRGSGPAVGQLFAVQGSVPGLGMLE